MLQLSENEDYYRIPESMTIISIVFGLISTFVGAIHLFVLWKMKENVNYGGFQFSSVVMLRSLVAADELRGILILAGVFRYFIVYNTNIGPNPQDPCDGDFFCKTQSFLTIWFNMIMIICMLFIGLFAAYQVSKEMNQVSIISERVLILVSVACWVVPFLLTLIPAFYHVLGEDRYSSTSGWCWITSCNKTITKREKVTFMILYSRGFEMLIFLTSITLFIFLKYITRKQERLYDNETYKILEISERSDIIAKNALNNVTNDSKLLFLINLTICFCRLPGIIRTAIDITMSYNKIMDNIQLERALEIILNIQIIADGIQSTLVFGVLLLCSLFAKAFMMKLIFKQRISVSNI